MINEAYDTRPTPASIERLDSDNGAMVREIVKDIAADPEFFKPEHIKRLERLEAAKLKLARKGNRLTLLKIIAAVCNHSLAMAFYYFGRRYNVGIANEINKLLKFKAVKVDARSRVTLAPELFRRLKESYTGAVIIQSHNEVGFEGFFPRVLSCETQQLKFNPADFQFDGITWDRFAIAKDHKDGGYLWQIGNDDDLHIERETSLARARFALMEFVMAKMEGRKMWKKWNFRFIGK